ncbi:hypothetical protein [Neomegalonema sp.]|uniref:hypothetical protein n=1 Tax=Neomegalonema sp. TaxID=2039713 RepID=UPI0026154F79|nr:hypothetical protein [Neomegalonema sp.]MDD2869633.1 hypothetical protein [Neomegalonema sp.]
MNPRKIVVEITLSEIDEDLYESDPAIEFIKDITFDYQDNEPLIDPDSIKILSDTADPQVGRKAESGESPAQPAGRLCPVCKFHNHKRQMDLKWVCDKCGCTEDAEEADNEV